MRLPGKKDRHIISKIKYNLTYLPELTWQRVRLARNVKYWPMAIRKRALAMYSKARYFCEDMYYEIKARSKHMEALLFSMILFLGAVMMVGAGNVGFLNSLLALLILVLVSVIYLQLRFQQRLLDQYVPHIGYVRVSKCEAFSDRVRTVNLYGAKEQMDKIKHVSNIRIRYDVVNDSFTPVSIQQAGISVKLLSGRQVPVPPEISVVDVEPKRSSGTDMTFRLGEAVDFDEIEFIELMLTGNVKKRVRIKPHLYVNVMLRGKQPEMIKEPFSRFSRRPEIREEGSGGPPP